jgi:membrane dipeptidase
VKVYNFKNAGNLTKTKKIYFMIIDGHLDLAWNALTLKRQLSEDISKIRLNESPSPWHQEGTAMVSLPELHKGRINCAFATIFAQPKGTSPTSLTGYSNPDEAYHIAIQQLEWYEHMENAGKIKIIRNINDFNIANDNLLNVLLLMEGADPIRNENDFIEFTERGVRAIGLAWRQTRYAGGAGVPGPLTDDGRKLLKLMTAKNIALDLSHLSDLAINEAIDIHTGPIFASHSNSRYVTMSNVNIKSDTMLEKISERQLDDIIIEKIASRNGTIGLIMYNPFINANWNFGDDLLPLSSLLPHIIRIKEIAGINTLAIGSDLDGGVGVESTPNELNSVADLNKIMLMMKENHFSQKEIAAIKNGNLTRFIKSILDF